MTSPSYLFRLCLLALAPLMMPALSAATDARQLPPLDPARVARIESWLQARPGAAIPTFDDRAFWNAVGQNPAAPELLDRAERLVGRRLPALTEAMFNEFRLAGNRRNFDEAFSLRRQQLKTLVLAEGIEGNRRFLPDIEAAFSGILAEPSWIIAAHAKLNSTWRDNRDRVDLGAAERVWTLATADRLLGERLSADTRRQLREEARTRVFQPYLARVRAANRRDFHWMNDLHNWNAVCNAGVLGSALLLVDSPGERAEFAAAFEAYAPFYLQGFRDDGTCLEGPGYWGYGFSHFLVASELLRDATVGRLDLLQDPKIRRIAEYGSRMEIAGGVYPTFADGRIGYSPEPWMLDFNALRFGIGSVRSIPALSRSRLYHIVFDLALPRPASGEAAHRKNPLPPRDWFPDGGVLIGRGPVTGEGLSVALKAGDNGEPHNHNDLGTFVVVNDGRLVLADLGADIPYTRDSFGPRRYESGLNNSFGHPVPRVAGKLQREGAAARAATLRAEFTDEADTWEIDLTSAYDVPELESLTRTFRFTRAAGGRLEIVDRAIFRSPQTLGSALVLRPGQKAVPLAEPGRFRIAEPGDDGAAVDVSIETGDATPPTFEEEPIIGIDPKTGPKGARLGFEISHPVTEAILRVVIRPAADRTNP